MGHREDLIIGAKRCLYERGYAHITARDIVAASGTNLASIGYHFGSKEALLNIAMMEAIDDWSREVGRALDAAVIGALPQQERFEAIWKQILDSFSAHRPLWLATFEIFTQSQHTPEIRTFLGNALQEGREGLTELFLGPELARDLQVVRAVGSFYQALMSGVIVQWLVDPERAPSAHDLAVALQMTVERTMTTASSNEAEAGIQ